MKYGLQHVRHVFLYANDVCPQQQVREAAPHAELADREEGVGKPEEDRLADEDDSLSATVNNTTSSSSILSFLLYFKLVGSLPPS